MPKCEFTAACHFYKDSMQYSAAYQKLFKGDFCESNNDYCAIFTILKVAGAENIPTDLFPNQLFRAMEIIKKIEK